MGLRVADAVIAMYDLTNTVTGELVKCGDAGVILKQVASAPPTFKVRFTATDPGGRTVVLDGVTDRDIARAGGPLGESLDGGRQQDRNGNGLR